MGMVEQDGYLKITVNGRDYEIDIADELSIEDVDSDMKTIASEIAFWGVILANAEEEKVKADAYYRNWRAKTGEELLEADRKLSEWKIKQKVEASEQFGVLKNAIAISTKNAVVARTLFDSFCRKANMLQSKGAMLRHELSADDMSVQVTEEDKVRAMKQSFKRKGKKVQD